MGSRNNGKNQKEEHQLRKYGKDRLIWEQARMIQEQRQYISLLERENRLLARDYSEISHAFFWQISAPLRKTIISFRKTFGIERKRWKRAVASQSASIDAGTKLFSAKELRTQRRQQYSDPVRISIVTPLYNTPPGFLRRMILSVQKQTWQNWELCLADGSDSHHSEVGQICKSFAAKDPRIHYGKLEENRGISANTNAALALAGGDYIGLMDHDDLLHPAALYEAAQAIRTSNADFVYTDEALFHHHPSDSYLCHFKPDYGPDTLHVNNYICHFAVFRKSLLDRAGVFDPDCDGSQDHDIFLRLTEKAEVIVHIPEILYYWRAHAGSVAESLLAKPSAIEKGIRAASKRLQRLGLPGRVDPINPQAPIYRVRYEITGSPEVSILIYEYDNLINLQICLNSILDITSWRNYEIIIQEDHLKRASLLVESLLLPEDQRERIRFVSQGRRDGRGSQRDSLAQAGKGEYLLFLSGNAAVSSNNWLQEMMMYAQQERIGAVGAKIYDYDQTIRQAGICIGTEGFIGYYFRGIERENPGYLGRLTFAQNVSAVSAECMMIRRELYEQMNGMSGYDSDELAAVDFCLRVREHGALIVWTPFAELSNSTAGVSKEPFSEEEKKLFCEKWKEVIEQGDPYYNPNFEQDRCDCAVLPKLRRHQARIQHTGSRKKETDRLPFRAE